MLCRFFITKQVKLQFILCFLVCIAYTPGTSGVNYTYLELGGPITRITSNEFSDIFVGGVNFLAQLSVNFDLLFNLTIGPATEPAHCAPNPAPCDNHVKVLQIDKALSSLLVCGSAYQGTCTLHKLYDVMDWQCVDDNGAKDGADIVGGSFSQNTVVHYLSPAIISTRIPPGIPSRDLGVSCRSLDFAQEIFRPAQPAPEAAASRGSQDFGSRRTESKFLNFRENRSTGTLRAGPSGDMANIDEGNDGDFLEPLRPAEDMFQFVSRLMVAGNIYDKKKDTNPLLLSMRDVTFSGTKYTMSYAKDTNSRSVGIDLKEEYRSNFILDYKLSYTWGNFSYFLTLQESDCDKIGPCVVTKIIRTCEHSSSVLPILQVPFTCQHNKKSYRLLTSAVIETVGFDLSASYFTLPVLVAAFGKGSTPLSTTANPMYGGAVCVLPLENLDKEFDFVSDICADGGQGGVTEPIKWISGSPDRCLKDSHRKGCSASTKNPYAGLWGNGNGTPALVYTPGSSVTGIFTYIPTMALEGVNIKGQIMSVFLLGSDGVIQKFSLQVKKVYNYRADIVSPLAHYSTLDESISVDQLQPVGVTYHSRALLYLSLGSKLARLSLDPCRQFSTCFKCQHSGERCTWCPDSNTCIPVETSVTQCRTAVERKCRPLIHRFSPVQVPEQGGSVLTLTGTHLGRENKGSVNVTVCGQPCDDVSATFTRIICTVRKKCASCGNTCNITVYVGGLQESEGNTSSGMLTGHPPFEYVVPNVTSFKPSFGPLAGGTLVTFEGQHVHVGSSTEVKVAGAKCDVITDLFPMTCRVAESKFEKPRCGPVQISIDNFIQIVPGRDFCLRPNPRIDEIKPTSSIESGGTTVTVLGSNLESASTPYLALSFVFQHSEGSSDITSNSRKRVTEICHLNETNTNVMTCDTPNVKNFTKQHYYDVISTSSYVTTNLSIVMDDNDIVKSRPLLREMRVYRDPTLFAIDEESEEARIYPRKDTLEIRGENIPTWIDTRSDINVTVGSANCDVIAITSNRITCNGSGVLIMYRKDYLDSLINGDDNDDVTQVANTTLSPTTNDTNITVESVTPSDATMETDTTAAIIKNITMSHVTPLAYVNRSVENDNVLTSNASNQENGTNVSDLQGRWTSPEPRPDDPRNPGRRNKLRNKTLISYPVKVTIGNYQKSVGNVKVGPKPITDDPDEQGLASLDWRIIGGAGGAGLLILVLVAVVFGMYCKSKKERAKDRAFYMESLTGSQHGSKEAAVPSLKQILESVMDPDKRADMDRLIIDLDRLTVGKSIGSGNFGCVYEGLLQPNDNKPAEKVAIKTLQDPAHHQIDLHGFVQEAVFMKDFQHPNVLGLVGLAEKEIGVPYVILPYMENGDLLTYIRDSSVSLTLHDVIKFGADIASGMAYLSSRKFVHRDLAARNCMLDNFHRVKVADFGLCRDIYEKGYYTSDNRKKLPIRWMAVESIEHGAYSTKSDVWSLGVVLWELLSRGVTPYPGVDGWDVVNFLRHRRLAPPHFCPDSLYNLMMMCWAKDPNMRPTFKTIQLELLLLIGQNPSETDSPTPKPRTLGFSPDDIPPKKGASRSPEKKVTEEVKQTPTIKVTDANENARRSQNTDAYANVTAKREHAVNGDNDTARGKKTFSDIVSVPTSQIIKNVLITIPACYSHRDISKTVAAEYIQLVDNYEPPPKFSNPFLRTKKTRSKRSSDRHRAEPKTRDTTVTKTDGSGYSVPGGSSAIRISEASMTGDEFDQMSRSSDGSAMIRNSKDGQYYTLEASDMRSSGSCSDVESVVSSTLNKTGSVGSLLDSQSRCSSSFSTGRASGSSSLFVPTPRPRSRVPAKKSPLTVPSPLSSNTQDQNVVVETKDEEGELTTSF